jgi:hypothetical protein
MGRQARVRGWPGLQAGLAMTTVLLLACGEKKNDSVSVSIAPSAAPSACAPGLHADESGGCVADEPPDAPEASASAAASAAPPSDPRCPDVGRADRVAAFDWSSYGLNAAQASRAQGTAGTAAETKAFAADVEFELRTVCSRLARELGAPGAYPSAEAACLGANEAMRAARAKLDAARVNVAVRPPQCYAPAKVFRDCMKSCDATATLPADEGVCAKGPIGGKCPGACDGSCSSAGGGKCPGTCQGECEGAMVGTCEGTCTGRCDGHDMTGSKAGTCKGKCEGRCSGAIRGECRGKCEGGCTTKTETCGGLCTGHCSKPWGDVDCGAGFANTSAQGQCEAFCATRADRKATCTPARVEVRVERPKDAAAAQRFAATLERHLPTVARLAQGMRGRIATASTKNQGVVAEGVKALTGDVEAKPGQNLGGCVGPIFRAVADGSASLRTNLKAAELIESGARGR